MSPSVRYLAVAAALSATVLLAVPARAGEPVELPVAETMLDNLEKVLKSKRSINEQIIADMEEVAEAYTNLAKPPPAELQEIPEDASEEEKKALKAANDKRQKEHKATLEKFDKKAGKWRKGANKQLLKAFKLVKVNMKTESNLREDVNIKAAELLAAAGDPAISDSIIRALETSVFKAKGFEPSQLFLEKAFAALATLGDQKSLEWMVDKFTHAKSSPAREVDRLIAAHKAMVLYKNVPGKLRHQVVDTMVKTYAGVESQAEQSKTDAKIQAAKQFWDRIKTDAIKVVQYYAGEPTDEEGSVLSRMAAYQSWFRDHKNPKKAPWKDEKKISQK